MYCKFFIKKILILLKHTSIKFFNNFIFKNINNIKIIPSYEGLKISSLRFSNKTRRFLYFNDPNKIGKISIDTSLLTTNLSVLGGKYKTDKSPLNLEGYRHGYTAIYSLLFGTLREKNINIAEIGIEQNSSTNMWRNFFKKANIYLFEYEKSKILNAKKQNLKKTFYHEIDSSNEKNISFSFKKIKKKFDIIIDDSTHQFEHQINIIKQTHSFLKTGGIMIVEDIYRKKYAHWKIFDEENYNLKLRNLKKNFSNVFFIDVYNSNNFDGNYKNSKLLVLIK